MHSTRVTPASNPVSRVFGPVLIALLLTLPVTPASAQQSHNVTLLSHMNLYGAFGYSSCWSYIHSDGREYAIEFANTGASIVRLTDPAHPVEVEFIPLRTSDHHEGRQYRNWFYVTTEVSNGIPSGDGLEIIRMTDPDHPKVVGSFHPGINWGREDTPPASMPARRPSWI